MTTHDYSCRELSLRVDTIIHYLQFALHKLVIGDRELSCSPLHPFSITKLYKAMFHMMDTTCCEGFYITLCAKTPPVPRLQSVLVVLQHVSHIDKEEGGELCKRLR